MHKNSYFHDPVHGHIYLTSLERATVDTLEFQRLRFIRQNSLMHYVFPGAFHTRFTHSIGACHNSYRLLKQLFPWVIHQQESYNLQVCRLACLLHDVGHGAFSHLLSHVKVNEKDFLPSLKQVLENPVDWELSPSNDTAFKVAINRAFEADMDDAVEHEVLSVLIIKKIFNYLSTGNEKYSGDQLLNGVSHKIWAQDIASLIVNTIPPTEHFINEANKLMQGHIDELPVLGDAPVSYETLGEDLKAVLANLVSGTLDADRMDYLLRDSESCGVNYGLYDIDGLISALKLVFEEGHLKLGLNEKRINTLDDFLWSRYQMFKQVYCHKTHNAYNILLNLAMNDLASSGVIKPPESLDEYLRLTDDYIMSRVFELTQQNPNGGTWVQAFAKRKLPKLLGVFEASLNDPVWKKDKKEIYASTDFEKYTGWQNDDNFVTATQKTEVVRAKKDSDTLPVIFNFDKNLKVFKKDSYLKKSVFFNPNLDENLRLQELSDRLNRRLLFFFKLS